MENKIDRKSILLKQLAAIFLRRTECLTITAPITLRRNFTKFFFDIFTDFKSVIVK